MAESIRRPLRSRTGFTLIEVLAVILLTALVLGVALDFYTDLSRATNRAADHTRDLRRATAILDRVARDLEAAVLVQRPPDQDALYHPWIFKAERQYAKEGSDRIWFITGDHAPRSSNAHESDRAQVAYFARHGEQDALELVRWSSPRQPENTSAFPADDDAQLLADDVAAFSLHFVTEDGERKEEWDSSQLVDSSELPLAVEIQIALAEPGTDAGDPDELPRYSRTVVLPMRPLDMQTLLDPANDDARDTSADGKDDGKDGKSGDGGDDAGDGRRGRGGRNADDRRRAAAEEETDPGPTVGDCVIVDPSSRYYDFYRKAWNKPYKGIYREWAAKGVGMEGVTIRNHCM